MQPEKLTASAVRAVTWVSPQVREPAASPTGWVAAVTAHARAAGVPTVTLRVAARNDRARGFYERVGFRPTGVRQTYQRADAPDLDEEELALDLADPG
jgi:ribosomal protein S18 acetylase RimI-like enzyme